MDPVHKVGAVTAWTGQGGRDPGRRPPGGAGGPPEEAADQAPAMPAATLPMDGNALIEALDRMVAVQPPPDEESTRIIRGRKAYLANPKWDLPLT